MRTIVCFGDSNTYGTPGMPDPDFWGRFPPDRRWPGVMAARLGPDWRLVEEGLPGRTTVHDDAVEGVDKNGLKALPMILGSHRPIDVLVVMLGCNDLKARFAVGAADIAESAGLLVRTALASPAGPASAPPKVLLVAPAPIEEVGFIGEHFRGGAAKSRDLGRCYAAVAKRLRVPFLDAGAVVRSDPTDGIHLTAEAHGRLGEAIAEAVRRL